MQKSYKVLIGRNAEKQIKILTKPDYVRVRAALNKISLDPRGHNTIKLTDSENEYRFKVGNFRILYTIEDRILTVYVFEVVNRRDAYR